MHPWFLFLFFLKTWNIKLRFGIKELLTNNFRHTFCSLSKTSTPLVLNRQYQGGWNTNQNEKKNTCPFYIVFQAL